MHNASVMDVITSAARQAGQGLARDFTAIALLPVTVKGQGYYASEADHRSEETLFCELTKNGV